MTAGVLGTDFNEGVDVTAAARKERGRGGFVKPGPNVKVPVVQRARVVGMSRALFPVIFVAADQVNFNRAVEANYLHAADDADAAVVGVLLIFFKASAMVCAATERGGEARVRRY